MPGRRFLLALHDAGGTVPPMLAVGQALAARGHDVTVLGQPSVAARAEAAGCRFEAFRTVGDYRRDVTLEEQLELVVPMMTGREVGDEVLALAERTGADALVLDCNLAGAAAAAETVPIPSALLFHSLYEAYVDTWFGPLWPVLEPLVNATRTSYGLDRCDDWPAVFAPHDRLLAAWPPSFESPSIPLPPNGAHVGFLVPEASATASPSALPTGPVDVLVSLSTTQQHQHDLLQTVLDGVGAVGVRALVTTAGVVDAAGLRVPDGVDVRGHVPHSLVLPGARAVVTHAGLGTVAAALHARVPLVCLPVDRDQPRNAARVVSLGAGVAIPAADATPDGVAEALDTVLRDDRYRDNAERVAAESRGRGGAVAAAQELESLAG